MSEQSMQQRQLSWNEKLVAGVIIEVVPKSKRNYMWIALGLLLVLICLSGLFQSGPTPATWLVAWTGWLAMIAGILGGAWAFWTGPPQLRALIRSLESQNKLLESLVSQGYKVKQED